MSKKNEQAAEQEQQAADQAQEQAADQEQAQEQAEEGEDKVPVTEDEAEAEHAPDQVDSEHRDEEDGLDPPADEELPDNVAPLPDEVKKSIEAEYPVLQKHGSHDAAMKGLQTDASGGYDRSKL